MQCGIHVAQIFISELKQVTILTTQTAWVTSEDWVKGCDWWKTSTLLPVDVRVVKNVTCLSSLLSDSDATGDVRTSAYCNVATVLFNTNVLPTSKWYLSPCKSTRILPASFWLPVSTNPSISLKLTLFFKRNMDCVINAAETKSNYLYN